VEIPVLVATVWGLARLGIGNPEVGVMQLTRLTTVFAGLAALLTAGGIGRLAAQASIERGGGRPRAMMVAARAHAFASAGLVIIAAIPHGHLPGRTWAALALPGAGLIAGAVVGALIGAVCGGLAPVSLGEVMALARRPSDALRQLLDPDDLVRFGAAVRDRTTQMFDGMFDPAAPPPPAPDPAPSPSAVEPPPREPGGAPAGPDRPPHEPT
jgi:hypothetical protein